MSRRLAGILGTILLAVACDSALAGGLETLLMPGRVIEGHADVEKDCGACHDKNSDRATVDLCTSCHEDVGADRSGGTGFHGRFAAAQSNECTTCHTDHEGRDADIVALDAGLFEHRWTDFPLSGAHLNVRCETCHAASDSYSVAPSACADCHEKDDVHRGGLGSDCQSCHDASDWRSTSFDHGQTSYPLTGGHVDVACIDCHRDNSFLATPQRCSSCHAIDDVHAGSNGDVCSDCHSTSSWIGIRFDHNTTGFPLSDGHARLQCTDCHAREDFKDAFGDGCLDCHAVDDHHQGRNGRQCESCHQPTVWPDTSFLHAETGFMLLGAHQDLSCTSCHKDASLRLVPETCGACHAIDDSHDEQLGEMCDECHSQVTWQRVDGFDHDLSGFPLLGLHATVACGECHASNRFHDAEPDCAACHRDDDPHGNTLGSDCGQCHNSNDWLQTAFDHDLHTSFPLDGGHLGLACTDCHAEQSAGIADVPSSCGGCHVADDVHRGQFGMRCGECHSTSSFRDVESLTGRRP